MNSLQHRCSNRRPPPAASDLQSLNVMLLFDLLFLVFDPTMASPFRNWTELPPELVNLFATKLDRLSDYIRFCGVCPNWRMIALGNDNDHKQSLVLLKSSRKKLPMLIIKTQEHINDIRGLYSVSDGVTYELKLPQPRKDRFFGSSYGWLMYYEVNNSITLLNPLTRYCISLPIFEHLESVYWVNCCRCYFLCKGILSDDPQVNPNYTVAVIFSDMKKLAIYKAGDLQWNFVDIQPYNEYVFNDVNFYKGNLYGVTLDGKLVQIDTGSLSGKIIIPGDDYFSDSVKYLVESQGELLMVQRFRLIEDIYDLEDDRLFNSSLCGCRATTPNIKIYKLVHGENFAKWVPSNNVGKQALFVGGNHSVSVSTIEFSECLSNSVYYVSHLYLSIQPYECCGLDEDSGIFNLEDGSFHSHHLLDNFEWHIEPPIWFVPNPDLG